MENNHTKEATCDNCSRVFQATVKRHYCSHCNKYYYVCNSCADSNAKCRFCGIPLKRRVEPQVTRLERRAMTQSA
jgi:hypothetical protein